MEWIPHCDSRECEFVEGSDVESFETLPSPNCTPAQRHNVAGAYNGAGAMREDFVGYQASREEPKKKSRVDDDVPGEEMIEAETNMLIIGPDYYTTGIMGVGFRPSGGGTAGGQAGDFQGMSGGLSG
jgi:hypothetical protein